MTISNRRSPPGSGCTSADPLGAENPKTAECVEQSGVSKDRDYRVAGYKVTKCAEQSGAAPP
jgi:hypothetical protein